ncbi:OmpA family protein [Massilia sp. erpn]|uniref:OmpA family protein n=1 Tax=Massilia sp. erpn TaxID=2738142 RepID=UPI0021070FE3|nr:OmpA family protein [Massilia sp. erpn]UTY55868.1 OmpA family protein [Massilia sp. erpn]
MKRMKIGMMMGGALAGIGVGACTTTPPSPVGFNYQVDNGQANRIVQVFDLSGNTVVQIRHVDPKSTRFYNAQNVEIPHEIVGENVVLRGLQGSFTVSSRLAASRIVRTVPLPTAVAAGGALPVPAAPAAKEQDGGTMLAEIARIKKEIAELRNRLAVAADAPAAMAPAVVDAPPQAAIIRVSFRDNSQRFTPPREVRARLATLAQGGGSVAVRGFTDSAQPSPASEALAKGRAAAAKRFLVRLGVDPKKISVQYEPAGKFAADNGTEEGRAANRRVEIQAS